MLLSSALDPIMCRVFSITHKKVDLRWSTTLPAQSIDSFKQLVDAFYTHFAISRAPKKTSTAFVNFQQGKRETLKEYLTCFNSHALEIKDLNKRIVIHQIIARL